MLRAGNEHPMDYVDFAIVHITPEWERQILKRRADSCHLFSAEGFYQIMFEGFPAGYYASDEDVMDIEDFAAGETYWCFIEISPGELAALDGRNGDFKTGYLCFNEEGQAFYKSSDDNDAYETAPFDVFEVCRNY